MRRLVIGLLGVGIVGTIAFFATTGNTLEVVNTVETVEKEVVIKELDVRIEEAKEAEKEEVERKLEIYRQELYVEIADKVKREYVLEIEASIASESY